LAEYTILAWQTLLRPPLPTEAPNVVADVVNAPLKALTCRNQVTSAVAVITSDAPVKSARLVVSDLAFCEFRIPARAVRARLVGVVPTPEAGPVCDPLYDVDEFAIDKSAAFHISIQVPEDIPAGVYQGTVALLVDGDDVAQNRIEVEVAEIDLPDVQAWDFFLNVWMNPAAIARRHSAELWSKEHFDALLPYVRDLAEHGQKTVVAPICYQPWATQTRDPYPSLITWIKRGDSFEFDFSVFDRYVKLHGYCGIDRAIHCYSVAGWAGGEGENTIEYVDADTGEKSLLVTKLGDEQYTAVWAAFLAAFTEHLEDRGWLAKTYIAFDERPDDTMRMMIEFLDKHAPDLKISLAGNTKEEFYSAIDDLSLQIQFSERGVADMSPAERASMGVAQLLAPEDACAITGECPDKNITTYYVCCGPAFPNTFIHSPLVESRMLGLLASQGGFDGFLRWSYNDWPDDPYQHPEWGNWPTGDVMFVYPGENGPVSSLRWEQLREGIQDYELALIASANIRTPEEMVDYEQAITLACRNVDGRTKSIGDIEIARRLLIPIAEHQSEAVN